MSEEKRLWCAGGDSREAGIQPTLFDGPHNCTCRVISSSVRDHYHDCPVYIAYIERWESAFLKFWT